MLSWNGRLLRDLILNDLNFSNARSEMGKTEIQKPEDRAVLTKIV